MGVRVRTSGAWKGKTEEDIQEYENCVAQTFATIDQYNLLKAEKKPR